MIIVLFNTCDLIAPLVSLISIKIKGDKNKLSELAYALHYIAFNRYFHIRGTLTCKVSYNFTKFLILLHVFYLTYPKWNLYSININNNSKISFISNIKHIFALNETLHGN